MIKGVNKKIIEINNPESIYFEKAVFYLRPEVMELPQQIAEDEIERYTAHLGIYTQKKKSSGRSLLIILSCITILLSAVLILSVI